MDTCHFEPKIGNNSLPRITGTGDPASFFFSAYGGKISNFLAFAVLQFGEWIARVRAIKQRRQRKAASVLVMRSKKAWVGRYRCRPMKRHRKRHAKAIRKAQTFRVAGSGRNRPSSNLLLFPHRPVHAGDDGLYDIVKRRTLSRLNHDFGLHAGLKRKLAQTRQLLV